MQPSVARLIDANANRAREAFRVLEDIARFALDDASLAADCKHARHQLAAALAALDPGLLLASRDTPGDVGREISTKEEATRASLPHVAAAAAARLTEALRALEEATKLTTSGPVGQASGLSTLPTRIEALRYRAYDLDRRLRLALGTGRAPQWRLCVLLTESLCTHHAWEHVARLAIEGGADALQLREKELPNRELLRRARRLVEIAASRAAVIVNDRPDLALLAGAHGVHLGQGDMAIADARRIAGFQLLIGASSENLHQAREAARAGADNIALGPMFPTTTKDKSRIAGPGYLRDFLADPGLSTRPHLAIGGVTPDNVAELAALGCRGVAVSSAACSAPDPAAVCARIVEQLRLDAPAAP